MNHRRLAFLSVLLLTPAIAPVAWSQAPPRRPTMTERISAFGRTLTGGNETAERATPATATAVPGQRAAFPQVDAQSLLPTNRLGSRTSQPARQSTQRQAPSIARPLATDDESSSGAGQVNRQPSGRGTTPAPAVGARTAALPRAGSVSEGESLQDHYALPGLGGSPFPAASTEGGPSGTSDTAREVVTDESSVRPGAGVSANAGRQKSFPTAASAGSAVRNSPQRRAAMHVDPGELRHNLAGAYPAPNSSELPSTTNTHEPATDPAVEAPSVGPAQQLPQPAETIFTLPATDETGFQPTAPVTDGGPISLPPRNDITGSVDVRQGAEPVAEPKPRLQSTIVTTPTSAAPNGPAAPSPIGGRTAFGASNQTRASEANILVSNQAPIISTDIRGPKQIVVGRESTFHVRVHNQGNAAADGIELTIRVPSWADIIDTTSTNGSVGQSPTADANGTLKWQLTRLEAGASESLNVRLVPRTSRPLELGVNWTLSPVGSRAVVEVQEPKLEMNVSGPDEVLFGKPQLYRFTLTNPGTGIAENVKIDLYPPGGGEKAAASNQLGNLLPGKSQTIEVELVARDAGKLTIKALASAEGDLNCQATKEVFCRKPELTIDWRGPEMKYAGTEATYHLRVRNPGTAPAEDVTVRATLPEGAQLSSASEGQVYDATRREIAWRVGSLGPGDDYYMELKCTVSTPGKNQLRIAAATAAGDLSDNKLVETNVIALADLKLEVIDPSGPVAVGDEALYEIRVQNRGASTAKEINVVALFSAGVEPIHVDGAQYSVSDGRVSFRAIEELPAGRQIVLRIRANAVQPGTHVFRAEVLCRDLEIKLAAEETTRFFADDAGSSSSEPGGKQADSGNGFDSAVR